MGQADPGRTFLTCGKGSCQYFLVTVLSLFDQGSVRGRGSRRGEEALAWVPQRDGFHQAANPGPSSPAWVAPKLCPCP